MNNCLLGNSWTSSKFICKIIIICCLIATGDAIANLADKIKSTTPGIVGIGIHTPIQSQNPQLIGTGFVVGDGRYVVTNYHVVSKELDPTIVSNFVAMAGTGQLIQAHVLEILEIDPVHDLALLKIKSNHELPALSLGADEHAPAGTNIYFTGFPIGAVLGLYPASHRGMVATIAPDVNPAQNADELTIRMLSRLKTPFMIYQLDATAYPGNSGSPVFDAETNKVIAIINKVFVSAGKESPLSSPSGISYAIPVRFLRQLAKKRNIEL